MQIAAITVRDFEILYLDSHEMNADLQTLLPCTTEKLNVNKGLGIERMSEKTLFC
jgi:hypothetical protein